MMIDVNDIISVLVGLPNYMKTLTTKAGRVCVTQEVILNDVLYVPDLTCNLISINQLIRDPDCCITLLISFV